MKIVVTFLLFFAELCGLAAQNKSFEIKNWYDNQLVIGTSTFFHSTTSGMHHSHSFDFKNTSNKAQVYEVIRSDVRRNIVGMGDSAYAHFCVGPNCFSSNTKSFTFTVNPGEIVILRFELDEATRVGYSYIEYQIINTQLQSEFIWLKFKYNNVVGLEENGIINAAISNFYPNPASNVAYLDVRSTRSVEMRYSIINSLGEIVYTQNTLFAEGNNKLEIPTENFAPGIYYFILSEDGQLFSKKLLVKMR